MPTKSKKQGVYVAIDFATVVVVEGASKADAVAALRPRLTPRRRAEVKGLKLAGRSAQVFWSELRQSYWYRFPDYEAASALHPKRVPASLRPLVAAKEPKGPRWLTGTSGAKKP